ncbi:MAG: TRASH domain-containing protein [Flavobacteriales bacterium]|nr:TRASH domain-containing protein [Flavobacteriales bacterium]
MKINHIILSCCIAMSVAACNTCSDTQAEVQSCGKSCSSSCDQKHANNEEGKFDFAMGSVCQAACGVSNYEKSDIVDMAMAKVGDITMCPVSGAIFKVKESSPILKHDRKTFHTCCGSCANKFKEDPDRFYKNV